MVATCENLQDYLWHARIQYVCGSTIPIHRIYHAHTFSLLAVKTYAAWVVSHCRHSKWHCSLSAVPTVVNDCRTKCLHYFIVIVKIGCNSSFWTSQAHRWDKSLNIPSTQSSIWNVLLTTLHYIAWKTTYTEFLELVYSEEFSTHLASISIYEWFCLLLQLL